jgi:hypothetical protein
MQYAGRCEADDAELRQMIIQWKAPDEKTDKWLACWCFDGSGGKLLFRESLTKHCGTPSVVRAFLRLHHQHILTS